MSIPRLSAVMAGLLIAGAMLGGCADSDPDGGDTAAPAPSITASLPEDLTVPPSGSVTGGPGTKDGGEVTLTGTVAPGVEPNCMLLSANGKEYLLLGGDRSIITAGARVTVTGKVSKDVMSTCMQGEPFTVSTVKAA